MGWGVCSGGGGGGGGEGVNGEWEWCSVRVWGIYEVYIRGYMHQRGGDRLLRHSFFFVPLCCLDQLPQLLRLFLLFYQCIGTAFETLVKRHNGLLFAFQLLHHDFDSGIIGIRSLVLSTALLHRTLLAG